MPARLSCNHCHSPAIASIPSSPFPSQDGSTHLSETMLAQERGRRISVPARCPNRPAALTAHMPQARDENFHAAATDDS